MKSPSARSRCTARFATVLHAALVVGMVAAGACNTEEGGAADAAIGDLNVEADLADVDLAMGPDMACTPQIQSCTDICGPVRDACTGDTFQCGACPAGLVCDLNGTHKCITPKVSCTDLAAECGLTRDSCGNFVGCGTCAGTDQECNPDNNTCAPCQAVTCEDLGYECGTAWLGCGPASNTTSCGDCSAKPGTVCNQVYHVCDPATASGKTNKQICDDAKLARGVECGIITNNNGGTVDCSVFNEYKCPAGQACNTRGIANRCDPFEPPLECTVAGYNCGTMPSACGGSISCGDCPVGLICNMAMGQTAGVCGPACAMPHKTCGVDYVGMCGKQLDDSCWPKLDCGCDPSMVCSTSVPGQTGTCVTAKACSNYTTGASGQPCSNAASPSFPKGDGSNLTCTCTSGVCVSGPPGPIVGGATAGTCCVNTAACAANACNTSVINTCTGATINCTCTTAGTTCNTGTNACVTTQTCATLGKGGANTACNDNVFYDNGSGGAADFACPCTGSGRTCINDTASVEGMCCTNTAVCGGVGTACSVTNTCTGASISCTTSALICVGGMLQTAATCTSLGKGGSVATTPCNDNVFYDNGNGGAADFACPCSGGLTCFGDNAGTEGACKAALTCATLAPNRGTICTNCCNDNSTYDNGVGGTIACPCTGTGRRCNGDMNTPGQQGACIDQNSCATYNANGDQGNICSNASSSSFPRGDGVNLTCACDPGLSCISGSAPSPVVAGNNTGTCCTPAAAGTCGNTCNTSVTTNSCTGATTPCSCNTSTSYCTSTTAGVAGTCLAKKTCASLGKTGAVGTLCNDNVFYDDGSGGSADFACACNRTTQPNNTCTNDSVSQEGSCTCVGTPCPVGMVGAFFNGCTTVSCLGG